MPRILSTCLACLIAYLLDHITSVEDDVTRGAAWLALYESLIRGETAADRFMQTLLAGLAAENEPLNRQNILSQMSTVFWKFLSPADRARLTMPSPRGAINDRLVTMTSSPGVIPIDLSANSNATVPFATAMLYSQPI